jgi:hypothetical protein
MSGARKDASSFENVDPAQAVYDAKQAFIVDKLTKRTWTISTPAMLAAYVTLTGEGNLGKEDVKGKEFNTDDRGKAEFSVNLIVGGLDDDENEAAHKAALLPNHLLFAKKLHAAAQRAFASYIAATPEKMVAHIETAYDKALLAEAELAVRVAEQTGSEALYTTAEEVEIAASADAALAKKIEAKRNAILIEGAILPKNPAAYDEQGMKIPTKADIAKNKQPTPYGIKLARRVWTGGFKDGAKNPKKMPAYVPGTKLTLETWPALLDAAKEAGYEYNPFKFVSQHTMATIELQTFTTRDGKTLVDPTWSPLRGFDTLMTARLMLQAYASESVYGIRIVPYAELYLVRQIPRVYVAPAPVVPDGLSAPLLCAAAGTVSTFAEEQQQPAPDDDDEKEPAQATKKHKIMEITFGEPLPTAPSARALADVD